VYVQSGRLAYRPWLAALKAGRTFATNGPLLGFTLEGTSIGGELRLPAPGRTVAARVTLRSYVPIDRLELVRNGEVVASIPLPGDRTSVATTISIPVRESGWYILRARGAGPVYPVLDAYPYATTSPIYLLVDGQPIRSRSDAAYFLVWIDRLKAAVLSHPDWNTVQERTETLETLMRARKEFELRLSA
jgi:TolB protein